MTAPDRNPYRVLTQRESTSSATKESWSSRIIRYAMLGTVIYAPLFLAAFLLSSFGKSIPPIVVVAGVIVHVAIMIVNFAAFLFIIRDWRSREFETSLRKYGWLAAFVYTGGIGVVWYILKFDLCRPSNKSSSESNL